MRNFTFSAIQETYSSTNSSALVGVETVDITATFQDGVSEVDYVTQTGGEDVSGSTYLKPFPVQISFNGKVYTSSQVDMYFGTITWGNGKKTVVAFFEVDDALKAWYMPISGDPLPSITTVQGAKNWKSSISVVADLPDGAIKLSDIDALTGTTDAPTGPNAGLYLLGTEGRDVLVGADRDDTINGLGENDFLKGEAGSDLIDGGAGNDSILGGIGHDTLTGGEGNDVIAAKEGNDSVDGGKGNDSLGGGAGSDTILGGEGNDTIGSGGANDTIDGGAGDDVTSGGAGNDLVNGGTGNDTMAGSYGSDRVVGGGGNDSLGGGTGNDTMYGGYGNDSIGAGDNNDELYGGVGHDFLAGGNGNDVISGGAGNDRINGGRGGDRMSGGVGADIFIFNEFEAGVTDIIADFQDGLDKIRLKGVDNGPGGPFGSLTITNINGGAVVEYDDQLIFLQGINSSQLSAEDFIFV